MFLSTNDNIAPWFKVYCRAHELARDYVFNPMWADDIFYVNDNRTPIRVWVPDKVYQCAMTLDTLACSHVSSRPL